MRYSEMRVHELRRSMHAARAAEAVREPLRAEASVHLLVAVMALWAFVL